MQGKIVCTGPLPQWVCEEFLPDYSVTVVGESSADAVLSALDSTVAAIIARGPLFIDAGILDAAPNLRVIGRSGVGFDTVDIEAASARGIPVVYTPGAMSRAVAEHTVALILAASKKLLDWHHVVLDRRWEERYGNYNLDLQGATVGIVGFGRIGREVWKLLRPFEIRTLVYDPLVDSAEFAGEPVRFVALDELLASSDIVTLHLPLSRETQNLMDPETLEKFKPGAIFVNTARGGLMANHDILLKALESGRLGYVALDVFVGEPPDLSHPLFSHPGTLFTAHVASNTRQAQECILRTMIDDMKAVLDGRRPRIQNVVNPQVLPADSASSQHSEIPL